MLVSHSLFAQRSNGRGRINGVLLQKKKDSKAEKNKEHWSDRLVCVYEEEVARQRKIYEKQRKKQVAEQEQSNHNPLHKETTANSKEKTPNSSEQNNSQIYEVVDRQPSFPGGVDRLKEWLKQHLQYPSYAQEHGIQGRVLLQFVVNADGSICDITILQSVQRDIDNEAIRVVATMPRWYPGYLNGKAVRVRFTLPVTFKLK